MASDRHNDRRRGRGQGRSIPAVMGDGTPYGPRAFGLDPKTGPSISVPKPLLHNHLVFTAWKACSKWGVCRDCIGYGDIAACQASGGVRNTLEFRVSRELAHLQDWSMRRKPLVGKALRLFQNPGTGPVAAVFPAEFSPDGGDRTGTAGRSARRLCRDSRGPAAPPPRGRSRCP